MELHNLKLDSLHTIEREKYRPVDECINPVSIVLPENRFQDMIFRNYSRYTNNTVEKDNTTCLVMYQNPNHVQYVIKNFQEDLFIMYPNNTVGCAYTDPNLLETFGSATTAFESNLGDICNQIDFSTSIKDRIGCDPKERVILIVDYLTIDKTRSTAYEKLFNYYAESAYNRFFYKSENATMGLRASVNNNVNSKFLYDRIRIVTVIKYDDLLYAKDQMLNVSKCGITLCLNNPPVIGLESPLSNEYKNFIRQETSNIVNNGFNITIADNHTTKDYYMRMGDDIVKLAKFKDKIGVMEQGIYLQITNNGIVINEKHLPLSAANSLGIYNSTEEARVSGDIKSQVELERIQADRESSKLKLSAAQLDVEKRKLDHKLSKEAAELSADIAINKAKVDFAAIANKAAVEAAATDSKLAAYTSGVVTKSVVDNTSTVSKTVVANEAAIAQSIARANEKKGNTLNEASDVIIKGLAIAEKALKLAGI